MTSLPRAHLVQLDIAWEDPQANHDTVLDLLDPLDIQPGDLILLPEMFATGFSMNVEKTNDKHGRTLTFLLELAADTKAFVQAGRTIAACHKCAASNVMTAVSPQGTLLCEYAKIHPFSLGSEQNHFAPGHTIQTWDWAQPDSQPGAPPLRVCPAICYDLRFPELFRLGLLAGAELFALGACWLSTRHAHWRALAIARAIENQAFVLAVNRTGNDPNASYLGGSIAISPTGEVLGELSDQPAVLSVPIDASNLRVWRAKFPAWKDAAILEGLRSSTYLPHPTLHHSTPPNPQSL